MTAQAQTQSQTQSPNQAQRSTTAFHLWADMIKLSHSVFALPFALIAAFLAARNTPLARPELAHLFLVVICMVGARSVAMTFNRIADAQFDARNPRTANRPLPAGKLSKRSAYIFLFLSATLFAAGCGGFQFLYRNPVPLILAIPVLILLCGYSLTKRFTRYSHFYLGAAIGFAPVAAWIAIHPSSLGLSALTLSLAVALWIAGFDIIYACQDIDIDRRDKLHSLPSKIGPARALWVTKACHTAVIALLLALANLESLSWLYLAAVAAVAILLIIENTLVKPGDYSKVNLAFFTLNGLVSLALSLAAILDILLLSGSA